MTDVPEDAQQIDTTDAEDAQLLLADPDDYHRSQRLKEIHQARRNVHNVLNEIDRWTKTKEHNLQKLELADAVTLYANELLPLIQQTDFDSTLPDNLPWDDIEEYTHTLGMDNHTDVDTGYHHHNLVFQRCNAALAEIRPLIEKDDTDEWEV